MELHHVTFSYVCGLLDGIERYAYWKDGVQYVGTTGTLLSDAKENLFRSLGLPAEDLRRVEKTRAEVGTALWTRCRKLGSGAMVAGVDPLDKVVQPSDQASGLRRLKEEAAGGGSGPNPLDGISGGPGPKPDNLDRGAERTGDPSVSD